MKNILLITYLSILYLSTSCAFKSEDEQTSNSSGANQTRQSDAQRVRLDSDKDGVSDEIEAALGTDSMQGQFPSFSVVDFKETNIEIFDFSDPTNKIKVTYQIKEDSDSELEYTPVKEKIAAHSYLRTINQGERPAPIDIYDLGVIKLSNFNYLETQKIRNFLIVNQDRVDDQSARITSRFSIKANHILGLRKLSQFKVELGFIETDSGFKSFGNTFDLMTISNTRAVINSSGDFDSGKLNMEAQVYVDRLPLETISHILDNDLQLAIKIIDYETTTTDGVTYKYSSQVQEAAGVGTLFSISTKDEGHLFFNARKESVEETLKRLFKEVESDGEGTLLSTQGHISNSFYPIVFEAGGNNHLKQTAWYLFSENDKLSDIPNVGETIMLGHFRNEYVAKIGKRLISTNESAVKAVEVLYPINDLKVGETVEIEISGRILRPTRTGVREISSEANVETKYCEGRDFPHRDFLMDKIEKGPCHWNVYRGWCGHNWADYTEAVDKLELYTSKLNGIEFYAEKQGNPIPLNSHDFFGYAHPIQDSESGAWKVQIHVDDKFIENYGTSIKIKLPKQAKPQVKYGFWGYTNCGHRNLGRNFHFISSHIREHYASGDLIHDVTFKTKRIFKN
ncbi:MAG: hypothetical protein COW00_07855 [Bdellovibrio sp. CG12_big_fil_rev_8_21_14_0_65_39_13]|nr:MAG: hypothetical protein COW78_12110 [Bdellovibrio sp. CG22_combo_CG10-13_8_21_14_all_39_27]PIQ60059.1 MAG: hypothetical protein COW00_07855 [Bdellovibrio sp. CG12_big_fil_rev_8_21_14_0_65_39_13]PIR36904.1 MAG: hypothetical protein COV37_01005 [Bdellovibrio sp. CG11_big_fil_rev_8_21_14_0_20_39_38]